MHSTRIALGRGSVSTSHGQQRILKTSTPDLLTYIQKAVKSGIYRSNEEIEEMNANLAENPSELKRIRWNVPRGSKIHDYPKEYEILSLNPPAPFRPKMPKKDQRKATNKYIHENRPTDRLARNYLSKQQSSSGEPSTAEEYYRRLLGSNKAAKMDSAMGQKSALLNKAYAVAVKQYYIMRTENLKEKDALDKVEELLKDEEFTEKTTSRNKAQDLARHNLSSSSRKLKPEERAKTVFPDAITSKKSSLGDEDNAMSMLYSENQRAFEGMVSWTQRLQAIPYKQWTVGATTAMDHWIAKRVLGLSEETWLALLEGDSPELMGRGRDIVMARHALFPETILEGEESSLQEEDDDDDQEGDPSADDDLDALLATLGGWNTDETKKFDWKDDGGASESELGEGDNTILELTAQLQDWRAKNVETPFDNWADDQKQKFKGWLQGYVATLTPESSLHKVDMEGTRNALLASPPQSKEDSDQFWDRIRDETEAEVFLQQLLSERKGGEDHPFWQQLDYSEQLERLVHLGAIRELADEYATDRSKFMTRFGDYLLEGLEMDHLVGDPTGSIRGSDLGGSLLKKYPDIKPTDRFRLAKIPYGQQQDENGSSSSSSSSGTTSTSTSTTEAARSRDLYRAWNKLKAGRAHYEEKMFKKGLLGLTYAKQEKK